MHVKAIWSVHQNNITPVVARIINTEASPLLYIPASHGYQPIFHADGSPLDADDFRADILT